MRVSAGNCWFGRFALMRCSVVSLHSCWSLAGSCWSCSLPPHSKRVLSQDGFYPVLPSQWEKSHKNHMVWYKRHISELRGIKKVVSAGTFAHNAPVMSLVGKVGVKVASYVSWQIGFAVTAREMWWLYDLLIVGGWELNGFLNAELWLGPLVQHREHNLHCPRRILGLPFLTAGETQQASEAVIQQH